MTKLENAAAQIEAAKNIEEQEELLRYHFNGDIAKGKKIMSDMGVHFKSKKNDIKKEMTSFVKEEPIVVEAESPKEFISGQMDTVDINIDNLTKMIIDEDKPIIKEHNKKAN